MSAAAAHVRACCDATAICVWRTTAKAWHATLALGLTSSFSGLKNGGGRRWGGGGGGNPRGKGSLLSTKQGLKDTSALYVHICCNDNRRWWCSTSTPHATMSAGQAGQACAAELTLCRSPLMRMPSPTSKACTTNRKMTLSNMVAIAFLKMKLNATMAAATAVHRWVTFTCTTGQISSPYKDMETGWRTGVEG